MSTSSTPASRRLVFAALGIGLGVYVALNAGLIALSDWSEVARGSQPFRNEDWLRYQLDASFEHAGREDILVVGASSARENILSHALEPMAPGGGVVLGALSQGTLEDTVLGLEYIERVHGPEHVPGTIVLGVTPRAVGGFNKGFSPFQFSLERYSPWYAPTREGADDQLVAKSTWEGLEGRFRFFFKQRSRYRKGLCAAMALPFGWPSEAELFAEMPNLRTMWGATRLGADDLREAFRAAQEVGFGRSLLLWMRLYVTQYKYHHVEPRSPETVERWVTGPGYWGDVVAWDPGEGDPALHRLLARVRAFALRNQARLFVVNMPEHPISRDRYDPANYARYLDILHRSFGEESVLDLRGLLSRDEFHDITHATPDGAARVTEQVNRFLHAAPHGEPT